MQDHELDFASMLEAHKQKIDSGAGSVLFGLNKMAEGLSLEGAYLTHVVITQLPFPFPGDALSKEREDRLTAAGGSPFSELMLPAMVTALKQMVGRLVRKETDTGRVTVLDPRLKTRQYRFRVLDALPEFTRQWGANVDWTAVPSGLKLVHSAPKALPPDGKSINKPMEASL